MWYHKLIGYTLGFLLVLLMLPFGIAFILLKSFWKVFGATIVAFFVIALFGGTMEECFKYSAALGFFIGVLFAFIDKKAE